MSFALMRRGLAALTVSALCSVAAYGPAHAGTVETLDPQVYQGVAIVYPGAEAAQLRFWVQLVWNPATQKLDRRTYSAWDPTPSLGLDLQWLPDDPAADRAGPLAGKGTLLFRRKGAPDYDPTAIVAQYRGLMQDGKASGQGEFLHASGFSYSGGWADGLMQGQGLLSLPNGDQYQGMFKAGKRDGQGIYIDATGAIYDGAFVADLRNGQGIVVPPNGAPYSADWIMGSEVPESRALLGPNAPYAQVLDAQYKSYDDLRIGVVVERLPRASEYAPLPLSYTARSSAKKLSIFPDDERLLAVWHGEASIEMTGAERYESDDISFTPSFLGAFERFEPLSLVFEMENSGTDQVDVVGAFLDVASSKRQPEPAVQLRTLGDDGCSGSSNLFLPEFRLENFGWTAAEKASITVRFGSVDGDMMDDEYTQDVGELRQSRLIDLTETLDKLGVDGAALDAEPIHCSDQSDEAACLAEVRATGLFGGLTDYISLNGISVQAEVTGTLDYDWTDADGQTHTKSSPFTTTILVGTVYTEAECGEGGEIVPVDHNPFEFHLDETDYRIALPLTKSVPAGQTARWRVRLSAPETSEHDFRLVLVLDDGREVASRPMDLLYFMPPSDVDTEGDE